jgi:hypothetical protein
MKEMLTRTSLSLIIVLLLAAPVLAGDFLIGNLNQPVPPFEPVDMVAMEGFALLVHPVDQSSCPEEGFFVETISMMLDFSDISMGQTFDFEVALYTADFQTTSGTYLPGAPICMSPIQNYLVGFPGLHEITGFLPPCVPVQSDDFYFLVVRFMTPLETNLALDDQPLPGVAYRDVGLGWYDTFNGLKTAAGKFIIWGDITCSVPPIATDGPTWGEIKGLYR